MNHVAIFVKAGMVLAVRSNVSEDLHVEVVEFDDDPEQAEDRWDEVQAELPFGHY